jgi:hypothetical protein
MTHQQQSNGPYQFSAEPRMVLQAQKMPQATSVTQVQVYENVMIDQRVIRGNTNSVYYKQKHDPNFKMPPGFPTITTKETGRGKRQSAIDGDENAFEKGGRDSFNNDFDRYQKKQSLGKVGTPSSMISQKAKNGDTALQNNSRSNLGQSKTLLQCRSPMGDGRKRQLIKAWNNRESREVWVEDHVRLQTDLLPKNDCTIQTDPLPPKPLPNLEYKFSYGIDCAIQVVESEIFNFDDQVQPLVNILSSRIIEESLTEVNQEIQLQTMQDIQVEDALTKQKRKEHLKAFMLKNRLNLKKDKDTIIQIYGDRNQALTVDQKLTSFSFAKKYLSSLETDTREMAQRLGGASDRKLGVIREGYGEYLYEKVMGHLSTYAKCDGFVSKAFDKAHNEITNYQKCN